VVEEIWYKSSVDGRDIQGWVAKPPGFDSERKYPLLVENHGGPISNYGPRFSPEIQLYAAAGYVVFYPNPRGSTSYGQEFGNLLYNNYPGDDYQDIMNWISKTLTADNYNRYANYRFRGQPWLETSKRPRGGARCAA
jgi:dipeptidyl aminopeptidase/acylaminoacyl peptidase